MQLFIQKKKKINEHFTSYRLNYEIQSKKKSHRVKIKLNDKIVIK